VDQPGLPSVGVRAVCDGAKPSIALRQRRYAPLGAEVAPETWRIPVCVRYAKGRAEAGTACTLLEGERATLAIDAPSCPAWIVGNADARGYYHVAYAPKDLRAVLAPSSGATAAERAGALNDASALVASGDLALADALALVPGSVASGERHVVAAGLDVVRRARDSAMDDAEAAKRARFLRAVYGPKARALGLARRPDEGVDAEILRPDVLWMAAVPGEDAALRLRAHDLALAWLKDPGALAPELVDTVLAAAGSAGDDALFAAILDKARREPDHRKVAELLTALGAFPTLAQAQRADALVNDPAFDIRDAIGILDAQFQFRRTRETAWSFVKSSFDAFAPRMRPDEVGFQIVQLTQTFCDEAHAAEVKAFFAPRAAKFDGLAHEVATAVESIGQCAAAFGKNRAGMDAFLARY
jgi:alanyl aminopeptidase